MSTREARLRTVLRVRRIQEDQRKADLARAAAAQAEAGLAVIAAEARLAGTGAARAEALTVSDFLARRELVVGRARQISSAASEQALAEGETDRSRVLLTEARTRTSGLERLVERGREARRLERLAADQVVAEESVRARRETA